MVTPTGPNPLAIVVGVLAELDRIGVVLDREPDGRLVLTGRTDRIDRDLFDRISTCRQVLKWYVDAATTTGYQWTACPVCGLAALVATRKPSEPARRCLMTPRCEGRYPKPEPSPRSRRRRRR